MMKTINEVMAIASGAWQLLRMRVVYVLILCVLVLIGTAYRYDVLSLGQHKALMVDVSLMLNTLAAILVAISVTFEISRELREGVASTLLSKPLGRTHYLIGKLVGISIAGIVVTGLIAAGFCVIFSSAFDDAGIGQTMLMGHLLIMASVIPMSALAVMFSVLVPESIAAIATVIVIWFAHSTPAVDKIAVLYGGILPDLNLFNLKAEAAYSIASVSWVYLALALLWGIIYSVFATSLASLVFGFRDLK